MTSRGGMQPNIEPFSQSGVEIFRLKFNGVGLSTFTSLFSNIFAKLSNCILAFIIDSSLRGPCRPCISLSSGILGSVAGSAGGIQQLSALPTITCLRGSHSFQELTIFVI